MPLSRPWFRRCWLLVLCLLGQVCGSAAPTLTVAAGIDPAPWDRLLRKYVDERGLVAYASWRSDAADLKALDDYLDRLAAVSAEPAKGAEEIAALINAYNAFTIRWILANYPTESIRELDSSWNKARWNIGGTIVSLDQIENQSLRPLFGWRVHATIVCAARSCPPLQPTAYDAANLHALTDRAYRQWLGRKELNEFDVAGGKVRVSPIFKWFKADFTGDGELAAVLEKYGPPAQKTFLTRRQYELGYLDYDWGLNDQGSRGRDYRPGFFKRLL
jgi:hypothetical protein